VSHEALNGEQFRDHLPPEPGTSPIPEGHVRLWHYTSTEALPSIREHGLSTQHAKGETYGEPNQVWAAAAHRPSEDMLRNKNFIEFHAHPHHELNIGASYKEHDPEHIEHMYGYGSHVTMRGDVHPSRILGVHEPWHNTVHYLENDPQTLHNYTTGDYKDDTTGDPHTDRALAYVRAKHAAGGYS
jgi:hypothetical protein